MLIILQTMTKPEEWDFLLSSLPNLSFLYEQFREGYAEGLIWESDGHSCKKNR